MTDLVVLQTHPIQYYAPLYRTLAERGNLNLHVVYLSDAGAADYDDPGFGQRVAWDIPLLDGYASTILEPGLAVETEGFFGRASRKLPEVLSRLSPRWLLIFGYASRMNWHARRWALRNDVRLAYTGDSSLRHQRGSLKRLATDMVVRHFFSGIDTFICTSEANEAYVGYYAPRESYRIRVPFAIDVKRFANGAPPPGQKRKYDFVWAGKFIKRKRTLDFLAALTALGAERGAPIRALLIGDGPLRAEVRAAVDALPSSVVLDWVGFANQKRMPMLLQSAETLVFTSEVEPYGLIATEASAAGLALVISDRIGCVGSRDIARPGVNAISYPPGDLEKLTDSMRQVLLQSKLREDLQEKSLMLAREHDLDCAAALIEAVCRVGASGNPEPSGLVTHESTKCPVARHEGPGGRS